MAQRYRMDADPLTMMKTGYTRSTVHESPPRRRPQPPADDLGIADLRGQTRSDPHRATHPPKIRERRYRLCRVSCLLP